MADISAAMAIESCALGRFETLLSIGPDAGFSAVAAELVLAEPTER